MNEQSIPTIEILPLARAIRFAFVALVLCLSYLNFKSSDSIHHFAGIFHDLLGGKPLPAMTEFVISIRMALLVLSCLIPLFALATLFMRRLIASFYLLGGLFLVTTLQIVLIYHALSAPLLQSISGMQGGGQ